MELGNVTHTVEEKRYGIEEVFALIGEEYLNAKTDSYQTRSNIVVDGFDVRPKSLRYMTFFQKGTVCACCGKQGTHFRLCGNPATNRRHFNLYADDGTLLTKDHIIPKSRGGRDHVDNMQPMCGPCNRQKGNKYPGLEVEYIVARHETLEKEQVFSSIEKAAVHVMCAYIHTSKKKREELIRASVNAVLAIQNAIDNGTPYVGYRWTKEFL